MCETDFDTFGIDLPLVTDLPDRSQLSDHVRQASVFANHYDHPDTVIVGHNRTDLYLDADAAQDLRDALAAPVPFDLPLEVREGDYEEPATLRVLAVGTATVHVLIHNHAVIAGERALSMHLELDRRGLHDAFANCLTALANARAAIAAGTAAFTE